MKSKYLLVSLAFLAIFFVACDVEENGEYEEVYDGEDYDFETITGELNSPWGMGFIDDELLLITESDGNLLLLDIDEEELESIDHVPEVDTTGQGGLLDVLYDDGYVYLTYSDSNEEGIATHLGRGELNLEEMSLEEFEVLRVVEPYMSGGSHFGSRILIQDDYLFLTTGDRGDKDFSSDHVSQDTSNELGAVLRLYKDGSIPEDNSFYGEEGFVDSIYTYGHRNVQGITEHPETGDIWVSEHGERDGDEINVLEAGGNYGWPITHYGCEYGTDIPVGEQPHENPDTVNPVYYWECGSGGFPPAGMTFFEGNSDWDGDLFVGNLAGQYLGRFTVNDDVEEVSPLLEDEGWRIRDVTQTPDDTLFVLTDQGHLVELTN